MTSKAGIVNRLYWRLLRVIGFKQRAWDQQYQMGLWSRGEHSQYFLNKIVALCRGGVLVEFGCAEGTLASELPSAAYSQYYGFDISEVAVNTARNNLPKERQDKCFFQQCDMSSWKGSSDISLILLEECLCYLSGSEAKQFLQVCKSSLSNDGVILVVDHSAEKHFQTIQVCRTECQILEDVVYGGRTYMTLR